MSVLDLKQLFQLPVHKSAEANSETGKNQIQMSYHYVKLKKVLSERSTGQGECLGLDYASGLDFIEPEHPVGLLKDMLYESHSPTKCELLLAVTIDSTGVEQFQNTMIGIANNLKSFVKYGVLPSRICCCFLLDEPLESGFFRQFYDESLVPNRFKETGPAQQEHDEFAHIFMQNIMIDDQKKLPLQLLFTVKQQHSGKLNSHLWFFGGFCEIFQPTFVMLLDAGTKPLKNALFYLYEALRLDGDCGGCCGEIRPLNSSIWKLTVPAQEVEYKLAHIFNRAFESIMGYVTVLPTALSAYRWEALQGPPLWAEYFKLICHPEQLSLCTSNIHLAEEQVLSFALVSKRASSYTVRYVKESVAECNVAETVSELMRQRKNGINGSWFALADSLRAFSRVCRSKHSCCRKLLLHTGMLHYYLSVGFSWFMVGLLYVVLALGVKVTFGTGTGLYLLALYVVLLATVFILALGVKPTQMNDLYKGITVIFGIYMYFGLGLTLVNLFSGFFTDENDWARWSVIAVLCVCVLNVAVNCCFSILFRGALHFLFMVPTYVNVFFIYAICNTHDCPESCKTEELEEFRTRWALVWALSNAGLGFALTVLDNESGESGWLVYIIIAAGAGIVCPQALYGLLYALKARFFRKNLEKAQGKELQSEFSQPKSARKGGHKPQATSVISPSIGQEALFTHIERFSGNEMSDNSAQSESSSESEESSDNIAVKLRYMREDLNMSVSFIAGEVGISTEKLREIENGEEEASEGETERILAVLSNF